MTARARRKCGTGAAVGNEKNRGAFLARQQRVHHTSEDAAQRNGNAAEKRFGVTERRRVLHATVHRTDDDGKAYVPKQRGEARRNRDGLMYDRAGGGQTARNRALRKLGEQLVCETKGCFRDAAGKQSTELIEDFL